MGQSSSSPMSFAFVATAVHLRSRRLLSFAATAGRPRHHRHLLDNSRATPPHCHRRSPLPSLPLAATTAVRPRSHRLLPLAATAGCTRHHRHSLDISQDAPHHRHCCSLPLATPAFSLRSCGLLPLAGTVVHPHLRSPSSPVTYTAELASLSGFDILPKGHNSKAKSSKFIAPGALSRARDHGSISTRASTELRAPLHVTDMIITNVQNHDGLMEATSTSNAQVEATASNAQVAPSA